VEATVSSEYLFQLIHARATNIALQASASKRETYPNGRESIKTAGLKMKAPISKAAVMVYLVPVGFCW
jgi:hypothetical protein